MLKIKDLVVTKGKPLLNRISLEIGVGKITLLLGKSGSGKTTLLRCLAQLEKKYEGEICCGQTPLRSLLPKERAQAIGFVPQFYALFPHMTVLQNCARPLLDLFSYSKAQAEKAVSEMLASLDMEPYVSSYPHELSGGQMQRVAIARALLLNPRFLLLDEPTSALDPESASLLIRILQKLRDAGKSLVISSQDMAFAREIYDSALFLENGAVVEQAERGSILPMSRLGRFLFSL